MAVRKLSRALVCFLLPLASVAGAIDTHSTGGSSVPFPPDAPEVVLYDQTDNPAVAGAINVTSQDFEAANDAFDTFAADDFVVPASGWSIESVDVLGVYTGGPAASFHVFFYSNAAGLPGALVASRPLSPFAGAAGNAAITLTPAVALTAGTYWVSVQARQDFTPNGQWFWSNRAIAANSPAAWRNPGGGFGTGCAAYGVKTTCLPSQSGPDQLFRLNGVAGCTDYNVATSGSNAIVPGTVLVPGSQCDDCSAAVALPFSFPFYGTPFVSVNAISNGSLQFSSANAGFTNSCLPIVGFNNPIIPYWDDLRTDGAGGGIFTSTSGVTPNRIFNIEWRAIYFGAGGSANFEARLF